MNFITCKKKNPSLVKTHTLSIVNVIMVNHTWADIIIKVGVPFSILNGESAGSAFYTFSLPFRRLFTRGWTGRLAEA